MYLNAMYLHANSAKTAVFQESEKMTRNTVSLIQTDMTRTSSLSPTARMRIWNYRRAAIEIKASDECPERKTYDHDETSRTVSYWTVANRLHAAESKEPR